MLGGRTRAAELADAVLGRLKQSRTAVGNRRLATPASRPTTGPVVDLDRGILDWPAGGLTADLKPLAHAVARLPPSGWGPVIDREISRWRSIRSSLVEPPTHQADGPAPADVRIRLNPTQRPGPDEPPPPPTTAQWELVRETAVGTIGNVGSWSDDDWRLAVDRTIAHANRAVALMRLGVQAPDLRGPQAAAALLSGSCVSAYLLRPSALGALITTVLDPPIDQAARCGALLAQPLVADVFSNALVLLRTAPVPIDREVTEALVASLRRFVAASDSRFTPLRFSLDPLT